MSTGDSTTTRLANLAELGELVGQSLGTSAWLPIEQERINTFVAHGYLTLSLIIPMWAQVLEVESVTTAINYGLNKVRFTNPVPAGGRVRLNATLKQYEELPKGGVQVTIDGVIELEGSERPAVVVEAIYRMFE
jgi:acyl dehydratase